MSHPFDKILGYTFKNEDLRAEALRHKSAGKPHNERLEFLGDAILSHIISEHLFQRFPRAHEGEMSRMRSNLVNGKHLAQCGMEMGLDTLIEMSPTEMKTGATQRQSVLENAFEALVGAIYLDGGLMASTEFVMTKLHDSLTHVDPGKCHRDAKTNLQEYLQKRNLSLPLYDIKEVLGEDHDQTFIVSCTCEALEVETEGRGTSRKLAEQEAAAKALSIIEASL